MTSRIGLGCCRVAGHWQQAVSVRTGISHVVAGPFDLDDARTPMGQMPAGQRRCDRLLERDDRNAGQWQPRLLVHGWLRVILVGPDDVLREHSRRQGVTLMAESKRVRAASASWVRRSTLPTRYYLAPGHRHGRPQPRAFSSSCSTRSTAVPCLRNCAMTLSTRSTSTGDRPADGSSSIKSRGRRTRPCATVSICCCPPD